MQVLSSLKADAIPYALISQIYIGYLLFSQQAKVYK